MAHRIGCEKQDPDLPATDPGLPFDYTPTHKASMTRMHSPIGGTRCSLLSDGRCRQGGCAFYKNIPRLSAWASPWPWMRLRHWVRSPIPQAMLPAREWATAMLSLTQSFAPGYKYTPWRHTTRQTYPRSSPLMQDGCTTHWCKQAFAVLVSLSKPARSSRQ